MLGEGGGGVLEQRNACFRLSLSASCGNKIYQPGDLNNNYYIIVKYKIIHALTLLEVGCMD